MSTNGTLTWLLGDHLPLQGASRGSTTITANADGTLASGQTYTAWGTTRGGTLPTDRQYTGQISESQLGIYFYNARYYDPYLARFISPDTLIPQPGNPLAWDRYSYTYNNPIRYSDPSGHFVAEPDGPHEKRTPYVILFRADDGLSWSTNEKRTINSAGLSIANRFAQIINHGNLIDYKLGILEDRPTILSAAEAFIGVFGEKITFYRISQTCAEYHMNLPNPAEDASTYKCWGRNVGGNNIFTFSNAPASGISDTYQWAVHEIFHAFDNITGNSGRDIATGYDRSIFDEDKWQQSQQLENYEIFADMGIAWTYSHWSSDKKADIAATEMNEFMQITVLDVYNQH